jgi:transposase
MKGMSNEIDADYRQQWLLPPALEDWIPAHHPARLVREFVDAVDLEELGFQAAAENGRPRYAVSLLTKVILYGYMNRVRSTRGWERACLNDIGTLWLTGMNEPDHTTLWRCWNENREGLRKLFRQLLQMATSANLVGMVLHAVDGTKILSQASEQKAWRRSTLEKKLKQLDQAIEEIMTQTERGGPGDNENSGLPEELQKREKLRDLVQTQLAQLKEKDCDHLNPRDEDARVMKCGARKMFAYNAQIVVDQDSKLIVAADVVTDESDNYQLVPMLEQVEANVGEVAKQTLFDAGYLVGSGLAQAEELGYPLLVNLQKPLQDAEGEPYHASKFVYDSASDQCICPQNERLSFSHTMMRAKARPYEVRVYRCESYETCPVRWQCSSSVSGRTVGIHPHHDALVRQREKQKDPAMRQLLKQRGAIVEPVFGWAKEVMGFRRWAFRGLEKVRTQWLVMCTAMNLRRLYRYWVEGSLTFSAPS